MYSHDRELPSVGEVIPDSRVTPIDIKTIDELEAFRSEVVGELTRMDLTIMERHSNYANRLMGLTTFRDFCTRLRELRGDELASHKYMRYTASYYLQTLISLTNRQFVEALFDYTEESMGYLWFSTAEFFLAILSDRVLEDKVDIQKTFISIVITGFSLELTPTTPLKSMMRWMGYLDMSEEMTGEMLEHITGNITRQEITIN